MWREEGLKPPKMDTFVILLGMKKETTLYRISSLSQPFHLTTADLI